MAITRVLAAALAVLISTPGAVAAAAPGDELQAIAARGRALYAYDIAAAKASDSVVALKPDVSKMGVFVGRQTQSGWTFDFGKLSDDGNAFLTAYRAVQSVGDQAFSATENAPPTIDSDFDASAARAIALARADFGPWTRPYNYAVIPRDHDSMYVYLYPAQTGKLHPLGGDVRYLISADGRKMLENHRMHKAILEIPMPEREGLTLTGSVHNDLFSNVPEDTDVFHVLIRRPLLPDFVSAGGRMFLIKTDGSIEDKGAAR